VAEPAAVAAPAAAAAPSPAISEKITDVSVAYG
jgi:hypothetical protein